MRPNYNSQLKQKQYQILKLPNSLSPPFPASSFKSDVLKPDDAELDCATLTHVTEVEQQTYCNIHATLHSFHPLETNTTNNVHTFSQGSHCTTHEVGIMEI